MNTFLRIVVVLLICLPAIAEEMVGYYIGSFDPVTEGHKAVVAAALKDPRFALKKVYITVNHNTDKDFNASMSERVEMMKRTFSEFGERVEILREPLEGRPAFARYLLEKHQAKVLGIFGDDTYEKNHKIFTTEADVHNFDYIKVARPEPAASALESVYVPVVHDMEIEADGTSSSKARELIAAGKDPVAAGVMSQAAYEFSKEKGLYATIPPERLPEAEANFFARYKAFITEMQRELNTNLSNLPLPKFKSTQSLEAQHDKFVRHIVTNLKMDVEQQLAFRPVAEKFLKINYHTRPLRSGQNAGIYFGSFDGGVSPAQKEVIRQALRNVDVLYLSALETSRKPIAMPVEERLRLLAEQTAEFSEKVIIGSIPNLESSAAFVRRVRNEYRNPTLMVFGSNVFAANYERLKGITNLRFASAPVPGTPPLALPPGAFTLSMVSKSCGFPKVAPSSRPHGATEI